MIKPMSLKGLLTFLALLASSCSHYALRAPDAEQDKAVIIALPDSLSAATAKVENYLRFRGHYLSTYRPIDRSDEVRVNQGWMRDSSLRFYVRYWDQRLRHASTWKSQWVLREISPGVSQLRVKTLELLFIGLPADADESPDLENKTSWFEGDPDELRSALEMRRFWNTVYPAQKLPPVLANVRAPGLTFEPYWKLEQRRFWRPAARPRFF